MWFAIYRLMYISGRYGGVLDSITFFFEECGKRKQNIYAIDIRLYHKMQYNCSKGAIYRLMYISGRYGGVLDSITFFFEECGKRKQNIYAIDMRSYHKMQYNCSKGAKNDNAMYYIQSNGIDDLEYCTGTGSEFLLYK